MKHKKRNKKDVINNVVENSSVTEECSAVTDAEECSIALLEAVTREKEQMDEYYSYIINTPKTDELDSEVNGKVESFKRANANILKSYWRFLGVSDELNSRYKESKRKKLKIIPAVPSNSFIDYEEKKKLNFASGINFYKLFLICFIGSFVGVLVELVWCFLKNGYFESRSGMVYGPLNPLYGMGAIVLTLALYKFRNRNGWISFFGGFIVGSVVEYFCSWGLEFVVGSRSWDYSHLPFNINGRICLLYSVFWGFLGYFWIKVIYPLMAMLILKIPNRAGKIITWCLFAFYIFDAVVSLIALLRWSGRIAGIEASNGFWNFIDMRFPDERMKKIYANMNFGN